MIILAVLFLILVYMSKNGIPFRKSSENPITIKYADVEIGNLVTLDTDGDSIADWEESLWGTDPYNQDTNKDGISDGVEIAKLKYESQAQNNTQIAEDAPLTKTDQLSRELLSTITALNQSGVSIDELAAEKLSESLGGQIENIPPQKMYLISEIKVNNDNSIEAMKKYNKSMGILISDKFPRNEEVFQILEESMNENGEINPAVLTKLSTVTSKLDVVIREMQKIITPSSLSVLHLDLLNGFERVNENLYALQKLEDDPVVAMGAITKYAENIDMLDTVLYRLSDAVKIN
ncbi:MAG: hypothetical protein KBD55_00980 [Candidatus Pacebacteria bacterium]|nr:hypothetical protein [Candidatus Paceibacterota bacterium]